MTDGIDASNAAEMTAAEALLQRVQNLEDLVEELTEIALVNRATLLTLISKKVVSREELRDAYRRIEQARENIANDKDDPGPYRILPAAGAYFLEVD